jgi:hypothetical protein
VAWAKEVVSRKQGLVWNVLKKSGAVELEEGS